jgi:hypothetical protein
VGLQAAQRRKTGETPCPKRRLTRGRGRCACSPTGGSPQAHTIERFACGDVTTGAGLSHLEIDAAVHCLITWSGTRFVAGDVLGRLNWLAVVD